MVVVAQFVHRTSPREILARLAFEDEPVDEDELGLGPLDDGAEAVGFRLGLFLFFRLDLPVLPSSYVGSSSALL